MIKFGVLMYDSKLRDLSTDFSVDIINLVKLLKSNHESVIANQIGRSATSIGANIYEAHYAQGKKDFISKLEIALKECYESEYWLELLFETGYVEEEKFLSLHNSGGALRRMLISSLNTIKQKNT